MAKLSKREQAAKKAGGSLDYKSGKISVAPKVTAKKVAPLAGAGPLMTGQTRQANSYGGGSQLQGAGPLLPGQTRVKESYKGGSSQDSATQRRNAAKAANIKKSGFDLKSAVESGGIEVNPYSLPVSQRPTTLRQGGSTFMGNLKNRAIGGFMDLMGGFGQNLEANSLARDLGGLEVTDEQRRGNRQAAYDNTIGIPTTNAQTPFDLPMNNDQYQQDLASVFGQQTRETDFGSALADGGITENIPQDTGRSRLAELFAPSANAQEDSFGGNRRGNNTNFDNTQEVSGIDPTLVDEMGFDQAAYSQQQNEQFGGGQMSDMPGSTTRNRSGRGSGMFATGKGLMNDDPYIKELRKAYSSNGGEKWLRKQFDELIKALDPTYAALQKEGQDALQAQLLNSNNQLASVMNANNTGDSEQRAQLMAGQQRDTQTALVNLLAKLAQNKSQDVSQYKSEYAKQRGQLAERNQSNQQTLIDKIRAYQQSQAKGQGGAANGKSLQALLTKAANMTSGGAQWAQRNAGLYGLNAADVTPYLQGNWGDGFRSTPAPSRNTGGDTIQELADTLGVDYATAQKMYLAEQGY